MWIILKNESFTINRGERLFEYVSPNLESISFDVVNMSYLFLNVEQMGLGVVEDNVFLKNLKHYIHKMYVFKQNKSGYRVWSKNDLRSFA